MVKRSKQFVHAKLDAKNLRLRADRIWTKHSIGLEEVTKITISSLPTLFDEIGILLMKGEAIYFMRETDYGFAVLKDYFKLDERAGADWYFRVEHGETIEIDLLS